MAKAKLIPVRINNYLDTAIKDIAEKTGESQASFIRQAIREKLVNVGYVVKEKKK